MGREEHTPEHTPFTMLRFLVAEIPPENLHQFVHLGLLALGIQHHIYLDRITGEFEALEADPSQMDQATPAKVHAMARQMARFMADSDSLQNAANIIGEIECEYPLPPKAVLEKRLAEFKDAVARYTRLSDPNIAALNDLLRRSPGGSDAGA